MIEIGMGTGQATLPFIQRGCNIIGIELGDKLSTFVAEKYRGHSNFKVIEAYSKIMKSLKKGGTLALFWNHSFPSREDDPSNMASA